MEKRWIILMLCLISALFVFQSVQAEDCNPEVILPEGIIQFRAIDGSNSYFDITIVTPSDDLEQGPYKGWCVEKSEQMTRGVNHSAEVYSSYDPNMPSFFDGPGGLEKWQKVNYLLNNIDTILNAINDSSCNPNKIDMQEVIWYICCGVEYNDTSNCSQLIIDFMNNFRRALD